MEPLSYPYISAALSQCCTWHISAEKGQVIQLSFHNFSLETQDACEFDYVEVHDSSNTADSNILGR